ncbi:hypothetical protein GCE86_03945 [Micromonospora terminaliae]|uniref:Uncharacterized protein n=1 Tax=Micromonospora terminaliae TaxID=1914461 RepID=A0AAJ3DLL9_9ACTN|nr:hypothetical protein [Micromonospora terminaliae]NES31037.1 hypothetical protein [Micromonospora terminaliae]QGL46274.1 hypothetical protein GCE86_03945 [Micromonospora terminaliae]
MTFVDQHEAQAVEPGAARKPRVLLLAFNRKPHERVVALAERLLDEGARVDVVVLSDKNWAELADRPDLRFFTLDEAEKRHPVMRAERIVVTNGPRRALNGLSRLSGEGAASRPIEGLRRGQQRVSKAFHKRVFMKVYQNFRPLVLARLFDKRLTGIDLEHDPADLIVASDALSITLGWRLARRFPHTAATTSLVPPPLAEILARP